MNNKIVGIWEIDTNDVKSIATYGKTSFEFKVTGELIYTVFLDEKVQKMFLTFEVDDKKIITNQQSLMKKEETEYQILPNGKLQLKFGNLISTYIKKI
jgi:hypothetical protein